MYSNFYRQNEETNFWGQLGLRFLGPTGLSLLGLILSDDSLKFLTDRTSGDKSFGPTESEVFGANWSEVFGAN